MGTRKLELPDEVKFVTYWYKDTKWNFKTCRTLKAKFFYYGNNYTDIAGWDHELSKEELYRVENDRYPYTVSGMLLFLSNVEAETDDWRDEAMKHNFEKGYGVQAFTHICTQCNNVFVGTMEDTTCPNCKAKAEHTVQHQDGPTFTHCCSTCRYVWSNDKTMDFDCPRCSGREAGKALEKQEGGSHYKDMKIQPVEFIHANNIPFIEGCCIKYLCRWRKKNGVEDLKKVVHFVELLIELEEKDA